MDIKEKNYLDSIEYSNTKPLRSWKLWIFPLLLWSALVGADLVWNFSIIDHYTMAIAKDKGASFFNQVEITRIWNARHGGVYAIVTKDNQPNPYLKVPNRDIVTPDGLELTMINPAYMTRQIAEIAKEKNGTIFHITSLKPIRPENAADDWETVALMEFEESKKEKSVKKEKIEFINNRFESSFKYMAPLYVKQSCLKCHSQQGYLLGDIRGGISVTIPAKPFLAPVLCRKGIRFFCIQGFLF